jgi:hypothetical protein
MIIDSSRGWVRVSVGGRIIKIYGERVFPDDDSNYFVTSTKSITKWETGEPLKPDEMDIVKNTLEQDFRNKGDVLKWI